MAEVVDSVVAGYKPVGKHVMVDFFGCQFDPSKLEEAIRRICTEAKATIVNNMVYVFGPPTERYGVAILSESHIEVGVFGDYVRFNLYTCGNEADPNKIAPGTTSLLREIFVPAKPYGENIIIPHEGMHLRSKDIDYERSPEQCGEIEEELKGAKPGRHVIFSADGCKEVSRFDVDRLEDLLLKAAGVNDGQHVAFKHQFHDKEGKPAGGTIYAYHHGGKVSMAVHTWPEYGFVAADFLSSNGALNTAKIGTYLARKLKAGEIDLESRDRGVKPIPELSVPATELVGAKPA